MLGKKEKNYSSLSKWVNISVCVTLIEGDKSVQGKFDYQRKEKESNEGDLIIKGNKKRATRKT